MCKSFKKLVTLALLVEAFQVSLAFANVCGDFVPPVQKINSPQLVCREANWKGIEAGPLVVIAKSAKRYSAYAYTADVGSGARSFLGKISVTRVLGRGHGFRGAGFELNSANPAEKMSRIKSNAQKYTLNYAPLGYTSDTQMVCTKSSKQSIRIRSLEIGCSKRTTDIAIGEPYPDNEDPMPVCENTCGDGICAEVVCMALGCPCAETVDSCPSDCR